MKHWLRRRLGLRVQANKTIAKLCRGECIEIGALSAPAFFPNAISIRYADVGSKEQTAGALEKIGYFDYHQRKDDFVDVDIVFGANEPPLVSVKSDSVDTVFSAHSLEHSSNPIAALIDYIRVLRSGGIVYTIIPNKKYTYDRKRETTHVDVLIEKYVHNHWGYTVDEYRDVYVNTDNHVVYDNHTEADIIQAFKDNDGHHHIYTYDETNVIGMIGFVLERSGGELIYFDSTNKSEIHFAIRK
ncbi:methyltransferase domain-containing protein [Zhongshania aquimaris]|uniref:Class I SAM-dependent methyltransferase n=1 Tax=Zhongshania aquimaris TaxID=2857107 RepID=A0ABS6VMJ6_9GAMM|nr:methyltransferase domain-containing protein [Zhongshania aquimaris]MBW2939522.1 class I SAM-dependent methyltransferase [Zhongshania aquimaris]